MLIFPSANELITKSSISKLDFIGFIVNPSPWLLFIVEYSSSHEKIVCSSLFFFFSWSNFWIDCLSVLNKIESCISFDSLKRNYFFKNYHSSHLAKISSFEADNFSLHILSNFMINCVRSNKNEFILFDWEEFKLLLLEYFVPETLSSSSTSSQPMTLLILFRSTERILLTWLSLK